jgi:hypothetical protein
MSDNNVLRKQCVFMMYRTVTQDYDSDCTSTETCRSCLGQRFRYANSKCKKQYERDIQMRKHLCKQKVSKNAFSLLLYLLTLFAPENASQKVIHCKVCGCKD